MRNEGSRCGIDQLGNSEEQNPRGGAQRAKMVIPGHSKAGGPERVIEGIINDRKGKTV